LRILIINRYFYPDITSVPQLLTELSEDLVAKGVNISVVCSRNSYNGEKKHKKFEEYKGIKIHRVNNIYGKNRSSFYRLAEMLTFFINVLFKGLFIKNIDIIMVFSSPPMIALVGVLLGKIKKAKIIYVVEDLHPELEIRLKMLRGNSVFSKVLRKINNTIFNGADKVISLGDKMKETILNNYNIDKNKINIIPNWSDGNKLFPVKKEDNPFVKKFSLKDKFIVQYSGNMGLGHEFKTILEGIKKFKNEKNIIFQFIGGGVKKKQIVDFIKKYSLKNVMILPYQRYNDLNFSLNMADISLISIKEGIGGLLLPSKFYGIIAVGKPFILVGDKENEIFNFINEFKLGKFVKEGDSDGFIENIMLYYSNKELVKEEGKSLRKIFVERYDRKKSIEKYYNTFKSLIEK